MKAPAPRLPRTLVTSALLALSLGVMAGPARAETAPSDARSLGLAGATSALVSGPYLQLYNPASITQEPRVSLFFPLLVPSLSLRAYNNIDSIDNLEDLVRSFARPTTSSRTTFPDLSQGFTITGSAITPALGFASGNLFGPFSVGFAVWGKGSALLTGRASQDATSFFISANTLAQGFSQLGSGFSGGDVNKLDQELVSIKRTATNLLTADPNINGNGHGDGHMTLGLTLAYSAAGALGMPFEISFGTTAKVFVNPLTGVRYNNPIDSGERGLNGPISYNVTASTSGGAVSQATINQLNTSIDNARTQLQAASANPTEANRNALNTALNQLATDTRNAVSAKTFTLKGAFVTDVPSVGFGMDFGVQANFLGRLFSTGMVLENALVSWPAKRVTTTKVFSFDAPTSTFKPTVSTQVESVNYEASEPRAFKWGLAFFPDLGDTVVALDVHKTFDNVDASVRLGAEFGILSYLSNKEGVNNLRAGSTERIPLDFSVRTGLELGGGVGGNWLFGFGVRYEGIRIIDLAFTPVDVFSGGQARKLAVGVTLGSTWQF